MKPRLILPVIVWLVVIAAAIAVPAQCARAEMLFVATAGGATVLLTNEPCALKEVSNLPNRATWDEDGKHYEGCWGVHPQAELVMAYFSDRAVAIFPTGIFRKVSGA